MKYQKNKYVFFTKVYIIMEMHDFSQFKDPKFLIPWMEDLSIHPSPVPSLKPPPPSYLNFRIFLLRMSCKRFLMTSF